MQLIKESLKLLGLSDFDRKTYLCILKKGHTNISSLAKELKVERPTVYSALDRLQSFSLIPGGKSPYSRTITAEPPSRVLDLIEKQKTLLESEGSQLEKIMPNLLAEFAEKSKVSAFRLFEGKEQFLAVFEESLREAKDEIIYAGDAKTFIEYEGQEYEDQWRAKRIRKKIPIRMLCFKDEITADMKKIDKKEIRETRFMPKESFFQSSFMIYSFKVVIWNPLADRAIVIDDKEVTVMFKQIFELLWKNAK